MWAQALAALLGVWLMASPGVFGYSGSARDLTIICGAIAAAAGIIATAEVTRGVRWVLAPTGLCALATAFLLSARPAAAMNGVFVGLCLLVISQVRGTIRQHYGGGWRALFRPEPPPAIGAAGPRP